MPENDVPLEIPVDTAGPLSGLRVVELSSYVATPLCGTTLAQLGADVIRVEPINGAPDRNRWPVTDDGVSLYWNGLNTAKRAIAVDTQTDEGQELVADLITGGGPGGGIVVSNTERWPRLGHAALAERRPDLIHVLLTGRHDGGTAVDYTVQAGSGFPMVTGPEDGGTPVNHLLPAWDLAAGYQLAIGLLAAERRRTRTGEGTEIRLALEDVALSVSSQLGYLAEAQLRPDEHRGPIGNHVYGTFGRDFTTADGDRFMLVALTPRHWADLLRITGLGEAVTALESALGADFGQEGERFRHRTALAGLVASWFERHTTEQATEALRTTRLLWSPYRTFNDLVADDARLLREHPLFSTVHQPGVGDLLASGSPLTVDRRHAAAAPAPLVGQHTDTVLGALGLPEDRLADLAARGVIAGAPSRPTTTKESS